MCPWVQVRATLQYGDVLRGNDMLCSISFDRDDEFFATAGVSRRIKVRARRKVSALFHVRGGSSNAPFTIPSMPSGVRRAAP